MRHGFVDGQHGQVHYVEHGTGYPVLLLHQTPRSWDEYRDVIPDLGRDFRAIALDTPGFGASPGPAEEWSIELFAAAVLDVRRGLGLDRVALVGHHTGALVALEAAVTEPAGIDALVLSAMPFVDAARREAVARRPPIDHVVPAGDGSHLVQLWRGRAAFYPPDRPDLLDRFVRDALAVLDRVEEGHEAVNRYRMEDRIGGVRAPTLALCGELDEFSLPSLPKVVAAVPGARSAVLPGTGVAAVDHMPERFTDAVRAFLRELRLGG